jgi:signal transduction histidine kinase
MSAEDGTPGKVETTLRALHRATLSLYADLSLERVLERIVRAAMDLANARYAALGIPDGSGGLKNFIYLGVTRDQAAGMPHQPLGRGLLGEMLRLGRSIRVPEIRDHPQSIGFPPRHPEMHSFLGVPIAAYGRSLGQIYLADKLDAPAFDEQDQRLIEMLAAHAAAAIENARLHHQVVASEEQLSQRTEELQLMNTMATEVSSPLELESLLRATLAMAMELFGAQSGEVFLRDEERGDYSRVVFEGEAEQAFWEIDRFKPGQGFIGLVAQTRKASWTSHLREDPSFLRQAVLDAGFETLVCTPLMAHEEVLGVLSLAFKGERPLDERELGLLQALGAGVGVALDNARLSRQARRVAILEERDRIGMELHDGIIQSLYAVGLNLDYAQLQAQEEPEEIRPRLNRAIEGLNAVIRDIRSYILDLKPTQASLEDMPRALERLVGEFKTNTRMLADLQVEPQVANSLQAPSRSAFFHITQEALANVAKHSGASRVWVNLRRSGEDVVLQVIDNGRGFDPENAPDRLGHGLSNMRERAHRAGGQLELATQPGDGTTLTVRVPVQLAIRDDHHGPQAQPPGK